MSSDFILSIDQGTTNTKAILVNSRGEITARSSRPMSQSFPNQAWVEMDALQIWESCRQVIDEVLQSGIQPTAIAVTNQRETVVLWDRATGTPLGPAIVWQCRRSEPFCEELRQHGLESLLRERTGLTIDPLFPAAKMRWLLENTPHGFSRAEQGDLCLGTIDSWLIWNLTGGAVHATDATNASRTQIFSLQDLAWDDELVAIFGIPHQTLPEVKASGALFGETVEFGKLAAGIPIASAIGDSHAALFGQGGFAAGSIKATYGTGSSLMMPLDELQISQSGLSGTVAWLHGDKPTYALEGNIAVTGAAVQWLGEFLGLENGAHGVAELAKKANGRGEVFFVPAFVGLGAPHWNSAARGLVSGLTLSSEATDLARAALDSIAFQVRDVFEAMKADSGRELLVLLADGGASANDDLMQFQADILGCKVLRNQSTDISALGAAYLAGLTTGVWASQAEVAQLSRSLDCFEPQMTETERERLYEGWKSAVLRSTLEASL